MVQEQVNLIQKLELEIQQKMKQIIQKQLYVELSVCERIITLIQEHINICEPITKEWLIAPDAIAIVNSRLVYQTPIKDPQYC